MNFLNNFFSSGKKTDDKGGSGKDPNNNNQNNSTSKPSSLNLKFNTSMTGEIDSLNNLIKSFKFDQMVFSNYEEYLKIIKFLMSKNNQTKTKFYENELDYLYETKLKTLRREPKPNESYINKMKEVGKICFSKQTSFEDKSNPIDQVGQNAILLTSYLKIESLNSFYSIRANNCVSSGKWAYEVTLLSNGLMQIGFSQLNTYFTRHGGVGDDLTSFGFDGYRKSKWNRDKKDYGKIWDVGDVLGICIDMDNNKIEFFLNGIPLGVAFDKVPKGPNIAFFPAISLSRGEACLFNFGQLPFKYEYKNYHHFDTPISKINGIDVIIKDLLKLWKHNILPLILDNKISDYQNLLLSSDIFDLISHYITDIYIFHEVILPFLADIIKNEKDEKKLQKIIDIFISSILNNFNEHEIQKNVGNFIFEHLSSEILEKSLRMGHHCSGKIVNEQNFSKMLNNWENLMILFMSLLKCDMIVKLLFEKGTLEVFKNVFNCNWFHMGDFVDYLNNKYKTINQSSTPVNKIIKELKKEIMEPRDKYYNRINETISKQLSDLTYLFLTDKRKIYDGKILKDKFNDLIKHGYSMIDGNEVMLNILGLGNKLSKQEPIFLRNIFMNLIYMFDSRFLNMEFSKITTSPWFHRAEQNDIYYDEVGIGGTISHVTSEYINKITQDLIVKSDDFSYDFFHKLIHMCNDLFINSSLKKFDDFYAKSKTAPISYYMKFDDNNGTSKFNSVFRKYFYVYPNSVQVSLYKMGFFILKYLMYLIKKNPYMIYFIPTSVTEIPFSFFKLLLNLKSPILFDREKRLKINKCSVHFAKDDFVQNLVEFYLILFADERIANPELKESLLRKVNLLLEKQILEEYFEDNEKIFESLIKGLLKDIKGDILSHSASRILLKLISPIFFGYKVFAKNSRIQKKRYFFNDVKNTSNKNTNQNVDKKDSNKNLNNNINVYFKEESLVDKLKKYFEGNFKVLEEFIKSYGIILNKVMTNYSMSLSSIIEIGVTKLDLKNINANRHLLGNHGHPQSDLALYQGLSTSYNEMCQLLKIYEFLLLIYPDEFLDTSKLNYINFMNILKNISTRVINKPYIDHIQQLITFINPKISEKIVSEKYKIELIQIGLSIAGIFIQIYKKKSKNKHFEEFCKKTANTPDLNIQPYKEVMKLVIGELSQPGKFVKAMDIIKDIQTTYTDMIDYLIKLRTIKDLTNDEMDKLISEDKLCILCYENPSDVELVPCKHKCCQNCYNQYKIDKDICFICQQKIESVNIKKPK